MPPINPNVLVNDILNAIQQSGGSAIYVSDSVRAHPRKFLITYQGQTYSLWIYIWTLTHGGRRSLPNEYRIQMTSVNAPLSMNPSGLTVLMGYYPDLGIFAGFDIERHRVFTSGSPSVQINITAIHSALQNGLSFVSKDNDEIVAGIRPDYFLSYCLNANALHTFGTDNIGVIVDTLESQGEIRGDLSRFVEERQRIVQSVSRYTRNANFRRQVMVAYENRCAVTRAQLGLVEAAHILPVASCDSSDQVDNGISLLPTFHKAFDNGLIYLDENYVMRLNSEVANKLRDDHLDDQLRLFCRYLEHRIHLPYDPNQRPRIDNIRLANKYRRISGY